MKFIFICLFFLGGHVFADILLVYAEEPPSFSQIGDWGAKPKSKDESVDVDPASSSQLNKRSVELKTKNNNRPPRSSTSNPKVELLKTMPEEEFKKIQRDYHKNLEEMKRGRRNQKK